MEGARRADVALGADLLSGLDFVVLFHALRLSVKYFDIVACGLAGRVALFDDNTAESRIDFLYSTIDGRRHRAMREHAMAAVHVKAHMWRRAGAPVSGEIARSPGPVAVLRRLDQIYQALDDGIDRHIPFSMMSCTDVGCGRCPHPIEYENILELRAAGSLAAEKAGTG